MVRVGGESILEVRKIANFASGRRLLTFKATKVYLNDKLVNVDEPIFNDVNTCVANGSLFSPLPSGVPTSKFHILLANPRTRLGQASRSHKSAASSLYCGIDQEMTALHRCRVSSMCP